MKHEFKIKENGFNEIRTRLILNKLPLILIAIGLSLYVSYKNNTTEINTLPFIIPVILIALSVGLFIGIKRQKVLFNSLSITISDDEIIRHQENTPKIKIKKKDISKIIKTHTNSLIVTNSSKKNPIIIPSQVENYDQLKELLSDFTEIEKAKRNDFQILYYIIPTLLVMSSYITTIVASNKIIVAISGTVFALIIGYSMYTIHHNKNIDNKTKKIKWIVLLPLFSVLVVMYFKIFGK